MKFYFYSEFGEILDIAKYLKDVEGHEVIFHVNDHGNNKIGEGILEKDGNWWNYIGQEYIWVFDGCAMGNLQDWLRSQGEYVIGGTELGDELENDRQKGQAWFKKAGFKQPFSKNFKDIDSLIQFVNEHKDTRFILKQNGDAPKSLNHMGKFDNNEDMLFHLKELKGKWNEKEFGKFDMDIMEVVKGLEIAASAFFNGHDFLKNGNGEVIGYLNFEEKKESEGNMGSTTGEMGTTFIGVTDRNKLFKDIILKPEIKRVLTKIGHHGVVDINCIREDDGNIVALEPTMRFGIPATSYEFIEGLETPLAELLSYMAKGEDKPVEIHQGVGMVMVVAAKPFPLEGEIPEEDTSIGERLWILKDGEKTQEDFSYDQMKHIHLENFYKTTDEETGDTCYKVATKNGYLLTCTAKGTDIQEVRDGLIEYIKDNVYLSDMKIRHDIGKRVEKHKVVIKAVNQDERLSKIKEEYEGKIKGMEEKHKEEVDKIKKAIKVAMKK